MSNRSWIIFGVVVLGFFGAMFALSQNNKIDLADVEVSQVIENTGTNGNIEEHVYGKKDSKVVLVEYADYQCSGCASMNKRIKVLSEEYKDLQEHIYIYPEDNFNFRQVASLNSWIIELYRTNNKKEALNIINKMINESENRLNENLNYRIKHIEENFIHNSKTFIKRLESGEFNYDNLSNFNNNLSKIIFD